jgi:histone H3/H4
MASQGSRRNFGTKTTLVGSPTNEEPKPNWRTSTDLLFSPSFVLSQMRRISAIRRISPKAAQMVAAVLEYLITEIIEKSKDVCYQDHANTVVKPRHIKLALSDDKELHRLFSQFNLSGAGVQPNIHPALLSKSQQKKLEERQKEQAEAEA